MKSVVGIILGASIIMMLWLNPGMLNGVTKSVSGPFKAWKNNPDSSKKSQPWQINPDEIKAKFGKDDRDPKLDLIDQDEGGSENSKKDPGETLSAEDPGEGASKSPESEGTSSDSGENSSRSRDAGESDPGYSSAPFAEEKKKKPATDKADQYTGKKTQVAAVGVQRAKGL